MNHDELVRFKLNLIYALLSHALESVMDDHGQDYIGDKLGLAMIRVEQALKSGGSISLYPDIAKVANAIVNNIVEQLQGNEN